MDSHQTVLLQQEDARGLVEGTGSESPPVAAPRDRVHLGRVRRELAALVVAPEALLHLLVVPRRHLGSLRHVSAGGRGLFKPGVVIVGATWWFGGETLRLKLEQIRII